MRREGEAPKPALATATPTAPEAQPVAAAPPDERVAAAPEITSRAAAPDATAADAASRGALPIIRIGQIDLVRGNVNFTDNFIKPNYTANMTGLGGTVTALASDSAEPATLTIAGKIDDEAPVDISGRLNPLAPNLFSTSRAATKGVDLPRLTPYSVQVCRLPDHQGQAVDGSELQGRGRASCAATNHLFLDQLTFGDKVESPSATKLPVLLAVSLLKNTRGEIDINLPISGSLNDPKFSVGGIIIQVIVNLLDQGRSPRRSRCSQPRSAAARNSAMSSSQPASQPLGAGTVEARRHAVQGAQRSPGAALDIVGRVDPAVDAEGVSRAKVRSQAARRQGPPTVRAAARRSTRPP